MTRSLQVALAFLAIATLAFWNWPVGSNIPNTTATALSQPPLPSASSDSPDLVAAALAPAIVVASAPPGESNLPKYIDHKGSLRVLAHNALNSRDTNELEYAKLYLARCRLTAWSAGLREWTKSPEAMAVASPKAAKLFRSFQSFCGDVATTRDPGLEYAIDAALTKLGSPPVDVNKPRDFDAAKSRLADSINQRASDLFMDRVRNLSDLEVANKWMVDQGIARPSDLRNLTMHGLVSVLVLTAATCEAWGCDEDLKRMQMCISSELCSDEHMTTPLSSLYAEQYTYLIQSHFGRDASKYPTWEELRTRAVAALRR